jgi:hypothetical protein
MSRDPAVAGRKSCWTQLSLDAKVGSQILGRICRGRKFRDASVGTQVSPDASVAGRNCRRTAKGRAVNLYLKTNHIKISPLTH